VAQRVDGLHHVVVVAAPARLSGQPLGGLRGAPGGAGGADGVEAFGNHVTALRRIVPDDASPARSAACHLHAAHGAGGESCAPGCPNGVAMNIKTTLLTASCVLALAACGGNDAPAAQDPAATADTTPAPTPGTTPGGMDTGTDPMAGTTAPGATTPGTTDAGAAGQDTGTAPTTAGDAAEVTGCETTIEGNDAMQFNVNSITIPSSCSDFTINLEHTGQLPEA